MIHLTMTPDVSSIRVYDQPNGYEQRLPYLGIVQVKHLDDKTVYLGGAVGRIDRETLTKAFALLRERGYTAAIVERHGRLKTIELAYQLPEQSNSDTPGAP